MKPRSLVLRAVPLAGFGSLLVMPAPAAWRVDQDWALIGELQTVLTYDTNLTARRENLEDVYGALTPKLTLSRRDSAARFELGAQVERTWFQDYAEFNSTDPEVNLLYEFPVRKGNEVTSHLDLHWGQDSSTNTDLGRRVRSDNWRGRWDQRLFTTGRTAFNLRLDGHSTDYHEADLNTNDAVAAEARIGYAVAPGTRLGLGYAHEWMRSEGALGAADTDGDEDRVTVRVEGDLLPKLSGTLETGVAFVSYRGAVERDDTAWVAAASVQWNPDVKTKAALRAARYNDFSPEGATVLRSELMVDLTRQVGRGLALRGGGGVSRVDTFVAGTTRRADAVTLLAAVTYKLTERFSAELSDRWTNQDEDRDEFDYERHLATAQVNFLF